VLISDFSKAGGVLIGHPQKINVGYAKIFATCNFMSAFRRWNEKDTAERHGQTSRYNSPQLIYITSICRGDQEPLQAIMQQMQMSN
jgi:hypothetical protein